MDKLLLIFSWCYQESSYYIMNIMNLIWIPYEPWTNSPRYGFKTRCHSEQNEQTISKPDRKHDVTSLRFCKVYSFKNCIWFRLYWIKFIGQSKWINFVLFKLMSKILYSTTVDSIFGFYDFIALVYILSLFGFKKNLLRVVFEQFKNHYYILEY